MIGSFLPHPAGLGEALGRALVVGETHVRLGEIGEQVAHDVGAVLAGEVDGPPAETHGREVLGPRRTDPGDVAEHERGEAEAPERLVDGQRRLVRDDRPVVVAHRVVHGRDRVQDVALVDLVIGGAVDLERPQAVLERLGEVARLVVHDADQVNGPRLDERRRRGRRDLGRLHRQPERLVGVAGPVGEARQPIQRLGLADAIAVGAGNDTSLERELARCAGVVIAARGGVIEQLSDAHRRRLLER